MKTPPVLAAALLAASVCMAQNPAYVLPGDAGDSFSFVPVDQRTEYSDSAHLAGSTRILTHAAVPVYSDIARTGTATFSIYGKEPADFGYPEGFEDGQPGVSPGAMADFKPAVNALWTSGPVAVSFTGSGPADLDLNVLVFSGINTLVPDEIFWSIKFENLSDFNNGGGLGPLLADAADLGPAGAATDASRYYERANDRALGDWVPQWLGDAAPPTSSLAVELATIPEPGTTVLLLAGALGLIRRRRSA